MKRVWMVILALCLVLNLCACGGDVSNVERMIGESELYSETEIKGAMSVVAQFFQQEFDGCTLTELRYDEERVKEEQQDAAEKYGAEVIILLATFDVDESGGDGSLNPNSTYTRYQWVLSRTMFGWEIQDWGYC